MMTEWDHMGPNKRGTLYFSPFFRTEEITNKIIDMKTKGREAILTYINYTSPGQSGGAVLQTSFSS